MQPSPEPPRPATAGDLDACAALARVAVAGLPTGWREHLARDLDDGERLLLVAEVDGEVAGYGRCVYFRPSTGAPAATAPAGFYLLGLVVAAEHRRRGIGRALTEARLKWIAGHAEEAFFFANARNQASIALHRSLGFEEVTRMFSYPQVEFAGGEGILFRLHLGR